MHNILNGWPGEDAGVGTDLPIKHADVAKW